MGTCQNETEIVWTQKEVGNLPQSEFDLNLLVTRANCQSILECHTTAYQSVILKQHPAWCKHKHVK